MPYCKPQHTNQLLFALVTTRSALIQLLITGPCCNQPGSEDLGVYAVQNGSSIYDTLHSLISLLSSRCSRSVVAQTSLTPPSSTPITHIPRHLLPRSNHGLLGEVFWHADVYRTNRDITTYSGTCWKAYLNIIELVLDDEGKCAAEPRTRRHQEPCCNTTQHIADSMLHYQ